MPAFLKVEPQSSEILTSEAQDVESWRLEINEFGTGRKRAHATGIFEG
jgi:hypothetical protein